MNLTPEQRDAVERETNLVVIAGAGTGKTEVMTQRVIRVLDRLDDIRELLAVTFTEKAAGEIRQRVYRAILSRIRESDGAERARFERMRDRYLSNRISTMHAFFADLVRRFSDALDDVDPGYRIIEGADKDALLSSVMAQLLDQIAYRSDHPLRDDLRRWLRQAGSKRRIADALIAVVDKRSRCREWIAATLSGSEDYAATRREIVASALSRLKDAFFAAPALRALVARLREFAVEGSTDSLAISVNDALALLDTRDAIALSSLLATKDGSPRRFGNAGSARTYGKDRLAVARSLMTELAEQVAQERFADYAFDDAIETPSAECLVSLARLADAAMSAYTQKKSNLRVLDFADLEEHASRLFDDESVLRALRKQFRAIFIDEFQDTNLAQWRMFRRLATEDGERFRDNSLFIVGDAKQAIYSFRGGEVEVFELARRDIGQSIGFASNFRSRPNLLAFTNRFFKPLLTGGELYEAEAQDLRYQADPDFAERFVANGGSVRHIVVEDAPVGEDGATRKLEEEARAVASLLRSICDGDRDDEYGEVRAKIERGESAVGLLFRRTTHQSLYEDALRAYGVPFVAAKGKGYFEREEIRDLRNAIRVVADPCADIALAGMLRSPLVGCSDDGLLLFGAFCRERGAPFAAGLLSANDATLRSLGVSDDDRRALLKARSLIADWREAAQYIGTAELVSRILADTGVYAAYAVGANGTQRLANAEKLVDLARGYESLAAPTLADFVRFLDAHIDGGDDEGDADLPDAGSIQLLTVHRAKGLQWPLVIVPDTNAKFVERNDEDGTPIAIGRLDTASGFRPEIAMRFSRSDGEAQDTAMWRMLLSEKKQRNRAEQKRLLYVAFTRAESHLVFCSRYDANAERPSEPRSWADWIHDVVGSSFASEEGCLLCVRTPADELRAPAISAAAGDAPSVEFDPADLWRVASAAPSSYHVGDEPIAYRTEKSALPGTKTPIAADRDKARLGELGNRLLPLAWNGVAKEELERRARALTRANDASRRFIREIVGAVVRVNEWLRAHVPDGSLVSWNRAFAFERDGALLTGLVDALVRHPSGDWTAYDIKYLERRHANETLPSAYRLQAELVRAGVARVLDADARVVFAFADANSVTAWSPTVSSTAGSQLSLFE